MCMHYCPMRGLGFSNYKVGDEILIEAGSGVPAVAVDTVDIVHHISGDSALTAGGHCLGYHDSFNHTGKHFEAGEYPVSQTAKDLLAGIELADSLGMVLVLEFENAQSGTDGEEIIHLPTIWPIDDDISSGDLDIL